MTTYQDIKLGFEAMLSKSNDELKGLITGELEARIKKLIENINKRDDKSSELQQQDYNTSLYTEAFTLKDKIYDNLQESILSKVNILIGGIDLNEMFKIITRKFRLSQALTTKEQEILKRVAHNQLKIILQSKYACIINNILPLLFSITEEWDLAEEADVECIRPDKLGEIKKEDYYIDIADDSLGSSDKLKKIFVVKFFEAATSMASYLQKKSDDPLFITPKDKVSNSQRDYVDKWYEILNAKGFDKSKGLLISLGSTGFLKNGLCNGFALLNVIEALGYKLTKTDVDDMSVEQLLSVASKCEPRDDAKIAALIDLIHKLMEPKDLNSELRQHDLLGAIDELVTKGLVKKTDESNLQSIHIGVAYNTVKMEEFIDKYMKASNIALRVGTAEHAIVIKKSSSGKFKIVCPNQNMLDSNNHTYDTAKECAKGLFELLSPGTGFLWADKSCSLALSLSLYGTNLPSPADVHTNIPSIKELPEDNRIRRFIARGANALMMAVTVDDQDGVDRYLKTYNDTMINEQRDAGAINNELQDTALIRAVTLNYTNSVYKILDKLGKTEVLDKAKYEVPEGNQNDLMSKTSPLFLLAIKKSNSELTKYFVGEFKKLSQQERQEHTAEIAVLLKEGLELAVCLKNKDFIMQLKSMFPIIIEDYIESRDQAKLGEQSAICFLKDLTSKEQGNDVMECVQRMGID